MKYAFRALLLLVAPMCPAQSDEETQRQVQEQLKRLMDGSNNVDAKRPRESRPGIRGSPPHRTDRADSGDPSRPTVPIPGSTPGGADAY